MQAVEEEGGFETVSSERKWPKIAERLGYGLSSKGISTVLQQHYKKILHPFDLFNQSKSAQAKSVRFVIVTGSFELCMCGRCLCRVCVNTPTYWCNVQTCSAYFSLLLLLYSFYR